MKRPFLRILSYILHIFAKSFDGLLRMPRFHAEINLIHIFSPPDFWSPRVCIRPLPYFSPFFISFSLSFANDIVAPAKTHDFCLPGGHFCGFQVQTDSAKQNPQICSFRIFPTTVHGHFPLLRFSHAHRLPPIPSIQLFWPPDGPARFHPETGDFDSRTISVYGFFRFPVFRCTHHH